MRRSLIFLSALLFLILLTSCGRTEDNPQTPETTPIPPTEVSNTPTVPSDAPLPSETPSPSETAPPSETPTPPEPTAISFLEGLEITFEFSPAQTEPILLLGEEDEWDSVVMRFPSIVYHDDVYHLFYEARKEFGQSFLAIGHAFSEDGIHWTKQEDNPILTGDGAGFDSQSVARPVVSVENDGTWVMYYTGSNEDDAEAIGRATAASPNGPWERDGEMLIKSGPPGAWDEELILVDQVLEIAGKYHLYYSGRAASGRSAMIGLATSSDGLVWEKYNDTSNDASAPLFSESDPILLNDQGWDRSAAWTPNIFPIKLGW